jgi:hypothetical protein
MPLRWCPVRWRNVKRQQFPNTPAMIGDPGGHRGRPVDTRPICCRLRQSSARMRRAAVVDGSDQVHAVPQGARRPRQRSTPACQRREALAKCRVEALDVGCVHHTGALRSAASVLGLCGRPLHDAAPDRDHSPPLVALHDLGDKEPFPGAQPWTPALACAHRLAEGLAHGSVTISAGGRSR